MNIDNLNVEWPTTGAAENIWTLKVDNNTPVDPLQLINKHYIPN
jgi:hypothetical protein